MTTRKLIGITGPAGAGKDTVADYLVSKHAFRKVSFAGPLKDGLCAMFGWSPEQLNDREWKESPLPNIGKSPRQLMQLLGTEYGRELVHPDLWLILARKRIEEKLAYRDVVISDVRFENEAAMIREMGGTIVHLQRDVAPVSAHASEDGIERNYIDYVIVNNNTIETLHQCVDILLPCVH